MPGIGLFQVYFAKGMGSAGQIGNGGGEIMGSLHSDSPENPRRTRRKTKMNLVLFVC
jgi:hypothetical protein